MSEKLGFIGQVMGVLYKPREIFSTVEEDDLMKGMVIIAIMVALAAYSSMVYMSKIPITVLAPQLQEANVDPSQIGSSMGFFAGIGTGVSVLVGWVISTLILHGLGKLSGGDGTMRRFFAINGFVAVPGMLNQVLRVIDASIMDSASLVGYFVAYNEISSKLVKAIIGVNLLNIWALAGLALLVFGLQENYNLQRGRAVLVALVPTILLFTLTYFTS
jgi:hypothetical protein